MQRASITQIKAECRENDIKDISITWSLNFYLLRVKRIASFYAVDSGYQLGVSEKS